MARHALRDRDLQMLAVLVLAGAAVRFGTMGHESLWFDESITALKLELSLGDALRKVQEFEVSPPLYFVCVWLWTHPFGTTEEGIRSFSALCGTLTIPAVYAAATELVSRRAGLIAAALTASSPLLIHYSQEGRSYGLLTLLCALTLLPFARARDGDRRWLAAWAAVSALALATHYFAVILIAPEALWLLWLSRRRVDVVVATAAPVATGLVLLALVARQRTSDAANWIGAIPLKTRVEDTFSEFVAGAADGPIPALAFVAFAAAVAAAVLLVWQTEGKERSGGLLAAGLALAGVACALLFSATGADFLFYRNLMPVWPALCVAAAAGLAAARAGRAGLLAAAVLVCAWIGIWIGIYRDEDQHRDDWRGAAELLGKPRETRVLVVSPSYDGQDPLRYYGHELHELPPQGVRVKELVVLGTVPDSRTPARFLAFRRASLDRLQDSMVVARYRARRAVLIPPRAGADQRLLVELPES